MLWTLCGFIDVMALHVALYLDFIGFSWCYNRGRYLTSDEFVLSVAYNRKLYALKDAIASQMSLNGFTNKLPNPTTILHNFKNT